MKQKTKYKSARLNLFVVLLCLSVCAISLWFFFKDLSSSSFRSDKDIVATISSKYKIAQRKFDDRVVWEWLQQGTPLYDGDTVRTADLSQATIHFTNGTNIDINENTMVQIVLSEDGGVKLSISDGNIEVDTTNSSNSVVVEMGNDVTVNLDSGSKLSAKVDESKLGVGINLKAGNAKIKNSDKIENEEKISAGESVKITGNGKITKNPITVTSVSENQRVLVFSENKKNTSVPIKWFPLEDKKEKVIVQTSTTKDFSKIKDSITVEDASKAEIPADSGTVYWRVFTEDDAENFTEGKLLFESVPEIVATLPEKKEVFNYYSEKPTINFAWRGNDFASKYKVEVGKDSSLNNPVFTQEVSSQNIVLPDLDDGTYYWRVTPYYETNGIGWYEGTDIKSFTISKQPELLPPTLFIPTDGKKFTYRDAEFVADFSWKGEKIDSEYTLQISKDKNFTNVVFSMDTNSKSIHQSFPVSEFPDGEYFWKIIQKPKKEIANILESDARVFTVEKFVAEKNKLLYPDDNYSVEKASLKSTTFLWKISAENETFYEKEKTKLQFSTSEDFSNIVLEKDVSGTSLKNVRLDAGKYFWRVTKGESSSEPHTIFILDKLARPKITFPESASKNLVSQKQDFLIEWEKVSDADFYKVKLLNSGTNKVVFESSEIKSEKITIPSECFSNEEQTFKFQVQAVTNETKLSALRKSEISEANFSAKFASLASLVSPAPDAKIDGLSAIKNGVNLKWKKGEDSYSSSVLKLWRVGAGGQLKLIDSHKNPRETVNVPRLSEGTYRWTVSAQSKGGLSLDAEETRDFEITAIPLLQKPVLEIPTKNQVFDSEYLRKNRSITFSWKNVKDATDYNFVLYQKLQNGKLKKIYSSEHQKSTQVKIKDLTILDVGTFQWQVTAQNRARDGFVYQNGNVAQQDFKIDFSIIKKVETLDPGELYGE